MEKRRTFTPEEKAKIVLEMLREEKTVAQIAAEYEVHPTQLHRWKAEAIENLPALFSRGASEAEKMRKQHEAEKEEFYGLHLYSETPLYAPRTANLSRPTMSRIICGHRRIFCLVIAS